MPPLPTTLAHVTPDGVRLHATRVGSGPPLVLLHGFTGSGRSWAPHAPALAVAHDVIAVDLLGHGESDRPADPARYGAERCAEDLVGLLDALGIARAAVLGYSMGGRMALHLALARPERVAALVLESASPGIADAAERAARAAADAGLAELLEREGVAAFVARWEALPLWASQAALSEAVRLRLREARLRNDAGGLASSLRGAGAGATPPAVERLGELGMPTLAIAGALDGRYAALARLVAARAPAATAAVVAGAGHAVHLERPGRFTAIVRRFLRTVPRAGAARWV